MLGQNTVVDRSKGVLSRETQRKHREVTLKNKENNSFNFNVLHLKRRKYLGMFIVWWNLSFKGCSDVAIATAIFSLHKWVA